MRRSERVSVTCLQAFSAHKCCEKRPRLKLHTRGLGNWIYVPASSGLLLALPEKRKGAVECSTKIDNFWVMCNVCLASYGAFVVSDLHRWNSRP